MDVTQNNAANKAIVARNVNVFSVERNAINLLVSPQEELVQKAAVQKTKLSTQVAILQQKWCGTMMCVLSRRPF
jgi:hypothetical protein